MLRFVMAVSDRHEPMRIQKFTEQKIPSGIVIGGIIEQPDLFVEMLRSFRKSVPTNRIHVLVPQETALIVPLRRPDDGMKDRDVKKIVSEQLESALESITLPADGFEVLSIVDDGNRLYADIVSVSLLDRYQELFKRAGFIVESWDTPHPDWTSADHHKQQSHVMVGIGERTSSIVLLNGGIPVMKNLVPVGRAHLVDTVRDMLNIQTYEAEKIIARYGLLFDHKEERVLRALYDTMRPLETEINSMIEAWKQKPYKTERERFPLSSLLLHGEITSVPGFGDRMSYATRTPAHTIDIASMFAIPGITRVMSRDEMTRFAPLLWKAHELVR